MESEIKQLLEEIRNYTAIANKDVLTLDEAALYMGISPRTLQNNIAEYPYCRSPHGKKFFRKKDLEDFLCTIPHEPVPVPLCK